MIFCFSLNECHYVYIYHYDELGRIIKELEAITMTEYQMEYDELGRVTKRTRYNHFTSKFIGEETYTYDAAGNILTATSEDGTTDTYTYGADNEILTMNGVHYGTYADGSICQHKVDGRMETMSYDYKSRLKKVKGDLYEYWYDAENTRANMYYEHTNMMYTYDASDGRNRLVWMKDHKYNTTIYTYGAEGLQWAKCNENEYKIYHYDYRGSVVMVTDINGEKVDEIRYDTYGKVIARMATDRLVVGYNGRDGVLTDPTGILYMRNRYYSPELRRFMSADEISGSVADSSTLNVFAYVNGNPISFVDPSGLTKEHGGSSNDAPLGSIPYGDNIYPIYVPNHLVSTVEMNWETVLIKSGSIPDFDWIQFVTGIELEDINSEDVYAGPVKVSSGYITNKDVLKKLGGLSLFTGVLNSALDNLHTTFIQFEFQECGDQRRVIISAGSSDANKLFNRYSGGTHSMYWSIDNAFGRASLSSSIGMLYHGLTGEDANLFGTYDIEITVDSQHKKNSYTSYLWIASDGTVMESPIIYPNDKVELGTRGFMGLGFDPLISLPLGGSSPVSPEYQALFDKYR